MTARLIMKLRVAEVEPASRDVLRVAFEHPLRPELPAWTPGAHVDLRLPDGKVRQYSLCGDPADRGRYTVAIKREADGRGGSVWAHANLAAGGIAHVSAPRNNFPLAEDAARHVFIAGGIGVTPFAAMARTLAAANGDFVLHLCARSAADAPLLAELRALCGDRLRCWFSAEGQRFDPATIGAPEAGTHLYVCGPTRLVDAVQAEADARGWLPDRLHIERFAATLDENFKPEPFEARIASTGQVLHVPADRSLLAVLRENGFTIPSSCELGTCGTCECGYRDGTVIHRDVVLPVAKRQDRLMPCVSRARVALTLDL
ncbi:PDR/VanB family oxidoreductase [Methylobacterium sp. NEAU 140]|uniref:PDR/VanB family oxidoreductase n=1 Tax=Methylobacterium sp. NEAU 140 TaxID=3064945 RepID=UPI002736A4A5|nr:PDR/VanB family oxidoreductase [Methylobacterium sp. NEAU 140]MDP4022092.1 PDR/VanB family oxidoreductase [Methylobacterium sp. NEAU 140]